MVSRDGLVSLRGRLPDDPPDLGAALGTTSLEEIRRIADAQDPQTALDEVEYLPVVPHPAHVFCAGINYADHAQETGREITARPGIFLRFADTLIGHGQPMVRPRVSHHFDFEGELAVVIGTAGRYIAEDAALDHVAGYSCFVDGSLRDYQKHSVAAGKNFPATAPFGPWLVTADEVGDPSRLVLETRLNGQVMQHAGLDQLINSVPVLVSYLSEITSLQPGDVIATGTPAGVGHRRDPQLWMQPGDNLELEISQIGTLSTQVVDEVRATS